MKTRCIICILFLTFATSLSYGQVYTNKEAFLEEFLVRTLIKKGDLKEGLDSTYYAKRFYYIPFLNSENLFKVGTFSSHSNKYILLMSDTEINLINIDQLNIVLKQSISFFESQHISTKDQKKYLIEIYKYYFASLDTQAPTVPADN